MKHVLPWYLPSLLRAYQHDNAQATFAQALLKLCSSLSFLVTYTVVLPPGCARRGQDDFCPRAVCFPTRCISSACRGRRLVMEVVIKERNQKRDDPFYRFEACLAGTTPRQRSCNCPSRKGPRHCHFS